MTDFKLHETQENRVIPQTVYAADKIGVLGRSPLLVKAIWEPKILMITNTQANQARQIKGKRPPWAHI